MSKIYNNILELIGNTPVVKLNHLTGENDADVYVKLEAQNPGGSVKDRIALGMIEAAEKNGLLKTGDTIVEPSSGNTGIGLALVGAAKGYQVVITMPESFSIERRKLMQAYGAKLVLTPAGEGMKGAIAKAEALAKENNWFMPLQFVNPANPQKHAETTGVEIAELFKEIGLDAFVSGVGTGGTITGAGSVLKQAFPEIEIVAVESAESPVLSGGSPGPHKIQGISAGFIPEALDTTIYSEVKQVKGEDAIATARNVGEKEAFLVGISAGAAVFAALEKARALGKGKKVLAVLPDNGERYLSTVLYDFGE